MNVNVNNQYIKNIDLENLPKHVAVIMDGNGRWAKTFGKKEFLAIPMVLILSEKQSNPALSWE